MLIKNDRPAKTNINPIFTSGDILIKCIIVFMNQEPVFVKSLLFIFLESIGSENTF
jgi:hypothetical protein